ncbi:DUF3822 family protein [Apibacter muscae]|uniref:DUF3822 family protein n=1 Tax=Apibacter muscae TaxID=2509004 RepID=A0A563D7A6_9FLAO|nr:DUF3822 family protein [Apibacter muscae]
MSIIIDLKKITTNQPINITSYFLFEENKVSYLVKSDQNFSDKKIFYLDHSNFIDKKYFNDKLKKFNFFQASYNFIDVSIVNDTFTLIPLEYFDEETAEIFLNNTVIFNINMGVRFNLLPEYGLAIVFYYPEDIDNLLIESVDKIRVTHTGFKFLSKIFNSFKNDEGVYINIYDKCFEVAVIEKKGLLIYNVFSYNSFSDILYYLQVISDISKINIFNKTLFCFGVKKDSEEYINGFEKHFIDSYKGYEDEFVRDNFTILDL